MSLEKIMVADDDQNICELLRLYLEKEQYTVVIANDGNEAVAKFNAESPALILLDIMTVSYTHLPSISGSPRSKMMTSGLCERIIINACSPSRATKTSYSFAIKVVFMKLTILFSSSTIRMLYRLLN